MTATAVATQTASLYAIARDDTTLQASLDACQSVWNISHAIALLYAPRSCRFARLVKDGDRANLVDERGRAIDVADVFEARVFNLEAELRWLNREKGKGRSVLLSEDAKELENYRSVDTLANLDCLEQQYLLWGEGWNKPESWTSEWSRLTLARIGSLPVPLGGVQRLKSVALKVREYLQEDEYGNLSVVEERLLKLESPNNDSW